jgi:hypothetical protein
MNCIIVFVIVVVHLMVEKDYTKRLNETSGDRLTGCKCSQLKVKCMFKVLSGKTQIEKKRRENF